MAYDPNQRLTPVKFSAPHVRGVFNARGVLVKVDAKAPLVDGASATVELHALTRLLEGLPSHAELRAFPGPLVPGRTHKGEVIQFCQSKIQAAATWMIDRDSYVLIWELLVLLLRQKNTIDGSDIAELLLKDRKASNPKILFSLTGNCKKLKAEKHFWALSNHCIHLNQK